MARVYNSSSDLRQGLYLMNRQTHETRKVKDKLYGVAVQFTPDSKAVIYSELDRRGIYYLWSDLGVYLVDQDKTQDLSVGLRARDPDVSRDGIWVTFTVAEKAVTGLAIAQLLTKGDDYKLGPVQKIYTPAQYDHVANPRFSPDGQKIYFTQHLNGKFQEDLMVYDSVTQEVSTLVADGHFNRYPTVNDAGELFYVSNRTGVDNLYQYEAPSAQSKLVTNMITGIGFPSFAKEGDITHASMPPFSHPVDGTLPK